MRYLLALALLGSAFARQDGTSDGSVSRARRVLESKQLPKPEEIRVYDFINLPTHDLPEPVKDEAVALDARLLRDALPEGDTETVLQVGFRTHRIEFKEITPLNLAIVIDKSGSMADDGKLNFVKAAVEKLVSALDERHILSIVVFDSEASVLLPATRVSDAKKIISIVKTLEPGSCTALHAGLMLGYEQVMKNFDPKRQNRVLLLSDGIANVGVTEPEAVIKDSRVFNDKGVDLTTVGIGLDYNDRMMRGLAEAGRGTYHFLDSGAEIDRVFDKYLQSLVQVVARRPRISVTLDEGVTLKTVHGYEFKQEGQTALFSLLDMPLAMTQVIPIEVRVPARSRRLASIRFEYQDDRAKRGVVVDRTVEIRRGSGRTDADVLKNITTARIATAVKLACSNLGREAHDLLKGALLRAETVYGGTPEDADLQRVIDLGRGALEIIDVKLKHAHP